MKPLWLLIFLICILGIVTYPEYAKKFSMMLTLNSPNESKLPRNFRISPFNSSGSGQFSQKEFDRMLEEIPSDVPLYIIDLRKEEHGFLNGTAVSWYTDHNWGNIGKTAETIIQKEQKLLNDLAHQWVALVFHERAYPIPYRVNNTFSEKTMVEEKNAKYFRLPLTDHREPEPGEVDTFLNFYRSLPKNAWMHIHCSAGKGRSTTIMAMQDIILNAKKDTLEQIIERQKNIGGVDLFLIPEESEKSWKKPHIEQRSDFIRDFYQYVQEVPDLSLSWSDWQAKKG